MDQPPKPRPPSARRVGLRIRVKGEHADEAARLFAAAGFSPIHVEHRDDGNVSFWFGKALKPMAYRIATCIPVEFFALHAIVGTIR